MKKLDVHTGLEMPPDQFALVPRPKRRCTLHVETVSFRPVAIKDGQKIQESHLDQTTTAPERGQNSYTSSHDFAVA